MPYNSSRHPIESGHSWLSCNVGGSDAYNYLQQLNSSFCDKVACVGIRLYMQALRHHVDTGFIDEYDVLLILTCVSNAVGDPRSIEVLPSIDNYCQLPRHLGLILKESGKTADKQVILLDHSAQLRRQCLSTIGFPNVEACHTKAWRPPLQALPLHRVSPGYSHVKSALP